MCCLGGGLEGRRVPWRPGWGGHGVNEGGEGSVCTWTAGIHHRVFIEHLLWARACVKGWGQGRNLAPRLAEASVSTRDHKCDECHNGSQIL